MYGTFVRANGRQKHIFLKQKMLFLSSVMPNGT